MAQPKHVLIREWIQEEIRRGHFVEGQRLPTEQELMRQFEVSRAPVQQAMRALDLTGVVVRRSGAGTFVSSWGLRTDVHNYLETERTGPEEHGTHEVLATRVTGAQQIPWASTAFAANEPVALITRLKIHASDRPIVLEKTVVDLNRAPGILDQDLRELTTIEYYGSIGLKVQRITTHLSAQLLAADDAAALRIAPETPVIQQHRTIFGPQEVPYETAHFYMHPTHLLMEVSHSV